MGRVNTINRANLRIARGNLNLDTEFVSQHFFAAKSDIVAEWEGGKSLPTWAQLSKLAKSYDVSELLLLSDTPLPKNKTIPDFRTDLSKDDRDERGIHKLINLVFARQRWLEKTLKEAGFPKNSIQGSGSHLRQPKLLADFISKELNIDPDKIKGYSGKGARARVLRYIISQAEEKDVFIGKTISYHRIDVRDMRGLFVSNDYCPFIVINRGDALSAQIFSTIHELAHLFRKSDAISNSLEFRTDQKNQNSEEIFCNRVAAELLLPEADFIDTHYGKADIDRFSEIYKVSQLAIFYRLKELGKIRADIQDTLEKQIKQETNEAILKMKEARSKSKGGDYNNSMRDSNGALFNRIVSNYYLNNRINYIEASNLLRFSVEKA